MIDLTMLISSLKISNLDQSRFFFIDYNITILSIVLYFETFWVTLAQFVIFCLFNSSVYQCKALIDNEANNHFL